jgi:trk system potassium uptake protein TrkA
MAQSGKFVIIGMGVFGQEIARTLLNHEAEVLIIEKKEEILNKMRQEGFEYALKLDSTDISVLTKFIKPEDTVVVAMGESFEDNVLTVGALKEIRVREIYTRATDPIQIKILQQLGVKEVLFPEKEEGKQMGLKLLYKGIHYISEYARGVFLSEIEIPKNFLGKSILELNIRNEYHLNIVALKEEIVDAQGKTQQEVFAVRFEKTILTENHRLIVIGNENDISRLMEMNKD